MIEEKLSTPKSTVERFIESANRKKILAKKCVKCSHLMSGTILFCEKCSGNKFEQSDLEGSGVRSEEHTSELQSRQYIVCRLLLETKTLHSRPYLLSLPLIANNTTT